MVESALSPAPRISVVMPVRDAGVYLSEAMESILKQTLDDFELVLLDDASRDGSWEALQGWAERDRRIRLFHSESPLGLAGSSHFVVEQARAAIIARMDSDDMCHPERLERQFSVLDSEESTVLVGTLWEGIDDKSRLIRHCDRSRLLDRGFIPPIAHGSIMFRRSAWLSVGGYRTRCDYWEDIDLFYRLSRLGAVRIIPEPLYRYRFHDGNSRVTVDLRRLLEATETLMRSAERVETGRDYEALLEQRPERISRRSRVYAYAAHTSSSVMGGVRPRLGGMLARPLAPVDLDTLKLYGEALVGTLSPRLARWIMNNVARLRDHRGRRGLVTNEVITWQFER